LDLPADDVKLVYLDLNHWISLAQASTGHANGISFVETLKACRAAKSAGSAVFVLSAIHYMEMNKIKDPSQRKAIADVMEELTGFASLLDRIVVMSLELDAMLPFCQYSQSVVTDTSTWKGCSPQLWSS